MSEIVIHAGTHKTGTTTIQDTLALNRRKLAEHGIVFPQVGPSNGQHSLATAWIDLPERYRDSRPARDAWRALGREHGTGQATVIVSSEELSRGRPGVDMRELAALVAPFGRRTLVCLLRGQLAYLQSIYLQVIRDVRIAPFEEYLRQALQTRHATGVMLDYGALYDRLLEGFAPEEILFLSYEAAVRAPGGVVGSLFARIGRGAAAADLQTLPAGNSNVSAEPLAAWAANQIAAPGIAGPSLVTLAREVIAETFGPEARTTLFTRAEEARVIAAFAPLNTAFEERYRRVDPGFALAPLKLPGDLVYRGQLTVPFWIRLGQRLRRMADA
jgi:hypothetical protein